MRDRFYLLKDHFVSEDKALARQSGVDKAVSRTDEFLVDVVDQMDEFERKKEHTREAAKLKKKLDADGERSEKPRLDVIERQLAVQERSLDQQTELMTFLLQKMP
ncbi:hypothetical protein I4F81_001809 [Pyropia yezoensis]|uniref:Uncharacterized protein n=1 Tax=Pyropia yezoensis TaxID=2788 RepID=A0ACC3BNY8_PYRYE|nr:hypothetical protein I4F81_001809 [Neopyropia yezoensis]